MRLANAGEDEKDRENGDERVASQLAVKKAARGAADGAGDPKPHENRAVDRVPVTHEPHGGGDQVWERDEPDRGGDGEACQEERRHQAADAKADDGCGRPRQHADRKHGRQERGVRQSPSTTTRSPVEVACRSAFAGA